MHIRGIRGATSVEANTVEAILEAARELLVEIVRRNGVEPYEVAAVIFTATGDLDAAFPAEAGRLLEEGAIAVDEERVTDRATRLPAPGTYLLRRGKRRFARVRLV